MAVVLKFSPSAKTIRSLHPTQVVCEYMTTEKDGKKLLQLNTYGSDERQIPGKLSQTLQIDKTIARQLMDILREEFGDA
ncbi:hypothetical protein J7400_00565 [Shimia sp. R9_2]|uniref:hypothetical protein n=1 Tax=Shimia sp. R9_2 TaxID=2821112 RepID=UPI001ADC7F4A|nr:hypothetical protein [Shimia sp. R9_2]MBO9395152.1 hypothetical protein [Shimia sp. R9_2]